MCNISYSDIIATVSAGATIALIIVGACQLRQFINGDKIRFTYKVDEDFADFLNDPENIKAKEWLLNDADLRAEDYDDTLRQLFDEIEGVYGLMKLKAINDELFYQLLSYYVEKVFDGKQKPSARDYLKETRDDARNKGQVRPDEIYIGIELLYDKVKRMAAHRKPESSKI